MLSFLWQHKVLRLVRRCGILCQTILGVGSAGASLHEPTPRTTKIGPQFSGDLFLVVVTFVLDFFL